MSSCGSPSGVTVQVENASVHREPGEAVFIPDVFTTNRVYFQTHSVLVIAADEAVASGKDITRVLNATTDADLVDVEIFKTSLATRLALGVDDVRARFVYGDNLVRIEMVKPEDEETSYGERAVVLRDFVVGGPSLTAPSATLPGFSTGEVSALTSPIMVGDGGVLTTGFIPTVFQ